MSDTLLYVAAAPFEAACHVPVLPEDHPSHRLHGHSFLARACVHAPERVEPHDGEWAGVLESRLRGVVRPLDYSLLNDTIPVPTDENIARWIRDALDLPGVATIGVQSTGYQGVDLDAAGHAHLWRRFRFEAAHQLPRVASGHPCGRMHGHGFEVILHVDQHIGGGDIGIDFERIGQLWRPIHERLHYSCLNEVPGLSNPTSERIAEWVWARLKPELGDLSWVTVYETTTAGCHYDGRHFRIWKEQRFESAVAIDAAGPDDPRARLHGHSYVTRLHLTAPLDERMGWTIDYGDVREAFTPVFRELDHHRLDGRLLSGGDLRSLLRWLKANCAGRLPALDRIDLFESPTAGATLHWGEVGPALPGRVV